MLIVAEQSKNTIEIATKALKSNQIICFATETVYALACNAGSNAAVTRLYKLKGRDAKKPIAVFVKNLAIAQRFLYFNAVENKIAQNFMPGMITLVLGKKTNSEQKTLISPLLNNNSNNLGLRIPDHQFCLKLLTAFDGIIAVTSANISNQEAAFNVAQVRKYFDNKIDLIIDGGICQHKIPSTVLKVNGNQINILRKGLITQNQINNLL